jgi:hypothetical protein
MKCNCTPPREIVGIKIVMSLSPALREVLSPKDAAKLRAKLCRDWGITSKSHPAHGANCSSNQTVVQLINDIVSPVTGELRERVRNQVIVEYKYDIISQQMVG